MKKEHLLTLIIILSAAVLSIGFIFLKGQSARPVLELNLKENSQGSDNQTILVHISGAVKNPGVYKIRTGSRLVDLVDLAGGACENSDLNSLNLAKLLEDGEKVFVPAANQVKISAPSGTNKTAKTFSPEFAKINLNRAGADELEQLPGIGPELAKKIVAYREKNGPFSEVNDLRKVGGIGDKKIEKIKETSTCY